MDRTPPHPRTVPVPWRAAVAVALLSVAACATGPVRGPGDAPGAAVVTPPAASVPERPGAPATADARGSTMMSLAGVPAKTIVWRCGATEVKIHHDNPNRRIVLSLPGKGALTWPQVGAVSGLRYGDDGANEFWMRSGRDARLTVGGRKYATCATLGR